MGGYFSGRPAQYATIESARRLDVRELRRRNALTPGWSRSWSWTCDGEPSGSIDYHVLDHSVELDYGIADDDGGRERIRITVPLRYRPCRYGGRRVYFACPYCHRTCEVIAMTSSGRAWGCRRCLRLRYLSQRQSVGNRLERRADKLYARAGTETDEGFVVKHKWMRWRTFNRLMDQANELQRGADTIFVSDVAALLARLGEPTGGVGEDEVSR
jgi:hypothetical protein